MSIRNFAIRFHRLFVLLFCLCAGALVVTAIAGCAGTFLSEAPGVLAAIEAGLTALTGVLALIPGAPSAIGIAINAAVAVIEEISTLVQQYKTTPDETTLQKIQAAITLAEQNLAALLSPAGISTALAAKIGQIVTVIQNEITAWANLIQSLQPAPAEATVEAHVSTTITKPLSAHDLKIAINTIIEAPTGDAETDAAFEKVGKIK